MRGPHASLPGRSFPAQTVASTAAHSSAGTREVDGGCNNSLRKVSACSRGREEAGARCVAEGLTVLQCMLGIARRDLQIPKLAGGGTRRHTFPCSLNPGPTEGVAPRPPLTPRGCGSSGATPGGPGMALPSPAAEVRQETALWHQKKAPGFLQVGSSCPETSGVSPEGLPSTSSSTTSRARQHVSDIVGGVRVLGHLHPHFTGLRTGVFTALVFPKSLVLGGTRSIDRSC